ncbi:MAG TPA: DsrH/TusB family sulfur metabolism protein [Methanothrix sp.]|nr:DsrH/TusB family sulfur metabolism protein [Methanothrix sp.]
MNKTEIFLLTKPPHSDRAKLCLLLMEHSQNAVLYLAGDGVYNLLEAAFRKALQKERVLACKEDLVARGVLGEKGVIVPENFYELLVEDMMSEGSRIYAF